MKKILICIPDLDLSGVQWNLRELIKCLYLDYDITIAMDGEVNSKFFEHCFKVHNIKLYTKLEPDFSWLKLGSYLWQKHKNNLLLQELVLNSDLVIDYYNMFFAERLSFLHKGKNKDAIKHVKTIAWIHDSAHYIKYFIGYRYFQQNLEQYDKCVLLSKQCMQDLRAAGLDLKDRCLVIYNPFDFDEIRKFAQQSTYFPLENDDYFVCVQDVDEKFDVHLAIDGFIRFNIDNHFKYRLYIIGDGSMMQEVKDKFAAYDECLIYIGAIENPYPYILHAHALISSPDYNIGEGFGNYIVAAMALDTLNISSNHNSAATELLLDGKCGYLFKPYVSYSEELCTCLKKSVNNTAECDKLISQAKSNLYRFHRKRVIPRIMQLFDECLKNDE